MSRYQPALLGGLFIGVLSSLPVVNLANCCCLWVLAGGVLSTYLLQQRTAEAIESSAAMLQGVLAGLIGGLIWLAGSAIMLNMAGQAWEEPIRRMLDQNPEVTPEIRDFLMRLMSGSGLVLLQAVIFLPVYAIFGMLGGLLGVAFFRKKMPLPPPAPPAPPISQA
jgi:hypothetical protein